MSVPVDTVHDMLTSVIGIGSLSVAVAGLFINLRGLSWRERSDKRVAEYTRNSRDLPCPRQRQIYVENVTREVWFTLSVTRFPDTRRFGLAMCLFTVATVAYLTAIFPLMAYEVDPVVIFALWSAFVVSAVNFVHVIHCMVIVSVNRSMYALLQGHDSIPVLESPSLGAWIRSFRRGRRALRGPTAIEILDRAARIQGENGVDSPPLMTTLRAAEANAPLLCDESIHEAFDVLNRENSLGGATVVVPEVLNVAGR